MADFEEAPVAALRAVFGEGVKVSGCWFHYAQALVKKMRKIGLSDAYQNQLPVNNMFRCLLSLPLLPVTDIIPAFDDIKSMLPAEQSAWKPSLEQLLLYVQRQWLLKSTIGPQRLSVRDKPARTNNAVESFHAALRRRIKVSHPNLFSFLGHLQRTVVDNQADINRLHRGLAIRRPKTRQNILNDNRIKLCVQRFDNGTYNPLQFLRAVSHSMGAHSMMYTPVDTDDESDQDVLQQENQHRGTDAPAAASSDDAADGTGDACEVCLLQPRDTRVALVPCGHQRFCASCADDVHRQQRGCPICRGPIQMILRLY